MIIREDAIYGRQSVDRKDSISIESQIEFCKYELRGGNFRKYTDKGYSGKNTDRPKFQEMMADIRRGLIKRVVVYKLDRISRSILDFATMMETFQEYNVEFVSSTEKFDTSTPMGRAMLNICIVFAQLERETIQKRVTDAYYSRCQHGFHMSGAAPYGFQLEPTTIEGIRTKMMKPDPETADIAKLMFEMYSQPGISFGDIARYFADEGILIYGKEMKRGFISQLLRNPIYAQADLDMYEFFKSQGTVVVNEATDFAGTNGCYLYQGRDVQERKNKHLKDQILVLAPFYVWLFMNCSESALHIKSSRKCPIQPKKKQKMGHGTNAVKIQNGRAVIIEKNPEALLQRVQRVRLIKNAKKEIILSTFAFQSDESGKLILGALYDAADRGVHIRLLVDGMESWIDMEGNPYFYGLSSHENVEIKLYNKANPLKPWKMMGRMHDKYLIADGKRYILGGRNTYNYFLGDFPGHKNYDRDVLVVCNEPEKENSVNQLLDYFETIWDQEDSGYFHNNKKLANRKSVKNAVLELQNGYQKYFEENKERICDTDYTDETFETEKITLVSNPIHTGSKEPVVWYQLGELMKNAKNRVKIHTPYIICNDMMYNTWEEIAENVSDFSIMTNSVANNGNPFGAADYAKNRNRILSTGINIWEYEGGYSYHGKSILIDDDLSVIGSFNMDMRSAYLDTELMLVIRSKDINKQLEESMVEYERVSRQVLEDGTYRDPYHVEPIELTKKRQRNILLVQHLLGWARYLF